MSIKVPLSSRIEFGRLGVPPSYHELFLLIDELPYVSRLSSGTVCDGWVRNGPRNKRCPRLAYWFYKAATTKKPHAKRGRYCWYHLVHSAILGTKYDKERAQRAEKKVRENALQERKATEVSVGQAT